MSDAVPSRTWLRFAAVGLGLAAGLGLALVLVAIRQAPEHQGVAPAPQAVRFIEVRPTDLHVHARGFGVARPAETWTATASVSGRVVHRHPALASGNLIESGTELLRIDPSRYRLAVDEARAELAALAAELRQLDSEAENAGRLLALERERLQLSDRELKRIEALFQSGDVSATTVDEQRRATLQQRQAVRTLENELALIPARRQRLDARIDQASTRLAQSREDLDDTRFVAPFDLRVRDVHVEQHDHVGAGQQLFQADSIAAAEVVAHVPVDMLRRLVGSLPKRQGVATGLGPLPEVKLQAIGAKVRLVGADEVVWPGRVTRIADGLDPRSRTVRVVVEVEQPYATARPPERPPLVRDMYAQVDLVSLEAEQRVVVPAAAVHEGEVYLVDADGRLERRSVRVAFVQRDMAVVEDGLQPGDRLIVDDLVPAIGGMPLTPRRDKHLERRLREAAKGEES